MLTVKPHPNHCEACDGLGYRRRANGFFGMLCWVLGFRFASVSCWVCEGKGYTDGPIKRPPPPGGSFGKRSPQGGSGTVPVQMPRGGTGTEKLQTRVDALYTMSKEMDETLAATEAMRREKSAQRQLPIQNPQTDSSPRESLQ